MAEVKVVLSDQILITQGERPLKDIFQFSNVPWELVGF